MAAGAVAQPVDLRTGVDPKEEVGAGKQKSDRGSSRASDLKFYQF